MDKYRVTLTAEERADLEQLVSVGKAAARGENGDALAKMGTLYGTVPGAEDCIEKRPCVVAVLPQFRPGRNDRPTIARGRVPVHFPGKTKVA